MVPDAQRGKLDAKNTKCLFVDYCEGIKAYRLLYLRTKKIIKNRDAVFVEDCMNVGKTLEMCPVVVDKYSKSSLSDDGEERNEQVEDHLVANEETIKIPAENDNRNEKLSKDG